MTEQTNVLIQNDKKEWAQPEVIELAVEETAANGDGGPDFASELS